MLVLLLWGAGDLWRSHRAIVRAEDLRTDGDPSSALMALSFSGKLPWRTVARETLAVVCEKEQSLSELDASTVPSESALDDLAQTLITYRSHSGMDADRARRWESQLDAHRTARAQLDHEAAEAALSDGSRTALLDFLRHNAETPRAAEVRAVLADLPPSPLWAAAEGHDQYGYWADVQVGTLTQRMRWIAPGTFTMGPAVTYRWQGGVNEAQYQVRLSRGYWLANTPCTQALWMAVMDNNPSHFKEDLKRPVEMVRWTDTQSFLNRLNARVSGLQARLPTEAEWEFAARAGITDPLYDDLDAIAWHGGNAGGHTHPVGLKQPNAWGLYDMIGNVWEWCADWYAEYPSSLVVNPTGPGSGSYHRVYRGGSWNSIADFCNAAYRYGYEPGYRFNSVGFRFLVP